MCFAVYVSLIEVGLHKFPAIESSAGGRSPVELRLGIAPINTPRTNKSMKRFLRKIFLIGLLICVVVTLQWQFGWDDAMTGAAYVDPRDDKRYVLSIESDRTPYLWQLWSPSQKVAGLRNFDQIFDTRIIRRGNRVASLPSSEAELLDVQYKIWNFQIGVVIAPLFRWFDIDDYILHNNVTGLLVIKSGEIVLERYMAGNSPQSLWVSMSVTKSVVSMLVGAAIADGAIKSLSDKVTDYLPSLEGSAYESVNIHDLLQMSSGVEWSENLSDNQSDANQTHRSIDERIDFVGSKRRISEPGETFNYNSAESILLGVIVEVAVGEELAAYLERKIWQPFGMESDANWLSFPDGRQVGACCISATLRDYGRIGLFALSNSKPLGNNLLADDWMAASTTPSRSYDGYGYQWWLREDGSYSARGFLGQLIHVNPAEDLVIVTHSAWGRDDINPTYRVHQNEFINAVTTALR